MTRRRRGFTLIESVVASGLFVLVGLVAFAVFKYGLAAHNRGLMGTDAQKSARELMSRLQSDMQSSIALQIPVGAGQEAHRSGVLVPPVNAATATNDIVLIAPAAQNVTTLDTSNPANYVLVRYARPNPNTADTGDKNAVYRRSYPFDQVSSCLTYTAISGATLGQPAGAFSVNLTDLNEFGTPPGTSSKPKDQKLTTGTVVTDTGWQEVVTLGGPEDRVWFQLSHPTFPAGSNAYDPYRFSVSVKVCRYVQPRRKTTDPNSDSTDIGHNEAADQTNDRAYRELTTDVTLQRFQ